MLLENPLGDLIWEAKLNVTDIKMIFEDNFLRDILVCWSEMNCHPLDMENTQLQNQLIWYNSSIRIENKPFYKKKWAQKGINRLRDLVNDQGVLYTLEQFNNKYDMSMNFVEYGSVLAAILSDWKASLMSVSEDNVSQNSTNTPKLVTKFIYLKLNTNQALLMPVVRKWEPLINDLTLEELTSATRKIYMMSNFPKLRSFQYRVLTKTVYTNVTLMKWGIKKTDKCSFCDGEQETLKHLFLECPIIKFFWGKIHKEFGLNFKLSFKIIILNDAHSNPRMIENFILLAAKYHIHRTKCMGERLNFISFKKYISQIKEFEEIIARKKNKLNYHNAKWKNIHM